MTPIRLRRLLFAFLLAVPLAAAGLPPHPFLIATKDEIAAARVKATRHAWAGNALAQIVADADAALKKPQDPPDKTGQWSHWYTCPTHGVTLQTVSPTQHRCPVDGQILTGDPYDAVVVGREHNRLAQSVLRLGLAYQFTNNTRYAQRAAAILLAYAERYPSYRRHNTRGEDKVGGGKVLAQTLDEAVWLIPLAQGYDLVWETLSPEQRTKIEEAVLLPAANVIREHKMGVHNIQCWKNSAVGLVGLVTGKEELVREAVDDPDRGFNRQIRDGVTEDGLWYEGSIGYHQYTMQALWPLAEAMRHTGTDLYSERYRTMYLAPLNLALPDGSSPGFNDSAGGNVKDIAPLYELAFARWKTPEFGALIEGSADEARARESIQALLAGAEQLPENRPVIPAKSVLMRDAGFAAMRVDHGANRVDALAVRFGRHGGGHGHPDKPGIVLYAAGQLLVLDPGSIQYGAPLHGEWYRTTVAHNTVVVDGANQSNADGILESWQPAGGRTRLVARADRAYPGVRMRRSLTFSGKGNSSTLSDVFEVTSAQEHTYDWVLHVQGDLAWAINLAFAPCDAPGKANGYQHIEKWECAQPAAEWEASWIEGGARLTLRMKGEPGSIVYRGVGPSRKADQLVPVILVRRRAAKTVFQAEVEAAPAH